MEPDSDPQPVTSAAWWTGSITALILAAVSITTAFDVWHPTQEQITAMTGGAAVIIAILFPAIGYIVRRRVTPNENVALTKAEVKVLDAWAAPAASAPVAVFPSASIAADPHGSPPAV